MRQLACVVGLNRLANQHVEAELGAPARVGLLVAREQLGHHKQIVALLARVRQQLCGDVPRRAVAIVEANAVENARRTPHILGHARPQWLVVRTARAVAQLDRVGPHNQLAAQIHRTARLFASKVDFGVAVCRFFFFCEPKRNCRADASDTTHPTAIRCGRAPLVGRRRSQTR